MPELRKCNGTGKKSYRKSESFRTGAPGGRKHHVHVDSVIEAAVGPVAYCQLTAFVE